ncbi:flagellar hook-length control protein FliK [Luteimonas terrae]|uniref:Flagellar hook-length control protein FliK n=1 Tax=Luteimonas terrae TaxID=1530191 RepID=A0A4R5U7X2_9GAMM|nr:flagellar hook-length control protein FliK [Luteimonas terrae]TDK30566.1 flagellar hook-length control protein FliK [Luteimonas terrae]
MSTAAPLPMFAASLAGATATPAARPANAAAEGGTDFARVAADLAAALQMGGAAPTQPTTVAPDPAMALMLPAAGTSAQATAGTQPTTTRHATPVEAQLDMRRFTKPADAVLDPALTTLPDDVAALLAAAPQPPADTAASPDDALSQQMFALLSGLAPPAVPADATPASDAADVLAGMRASTLPMQMPTTAQNATGAVAAPAVPLQATDAGADTSAASALDLSSLLSELPAMPRTSEVAAVATPVATAAGAQIVAAAMQDMAREEDIATIDSIDALPPGMPLAVHGSIRGPNLPVAPSPLQMPAHPDAGFDDELGARMAWVAEQKLGHAEIRLNPEHLGRIDLKIQLEGTRVSAEFNSANADVRQALEATLPKLREMLGQHGLQLGHADVGQRQQNAPQSQGQSAPAFGSGFGDERASANVAASTPAPVVRSRGLLDEYA